MNGYDYRRIDIPKLLVALMIDAKKDGGVWRARCPKHSEKSPSWSIIDKRGSEEHGLHHCFGCEYEGTALDLAVLVLDVSFGVAREWVIEKALGTPAPPLSVRVNFSGAARPFRLPAGVELRTIEDWPESIRTYATGRGITPEQSARWGMGYAIAGRLRARVVIPVYDARGALSNYTARSYTGEDPKYLGAKLEEHPNLDVIFGEQWWPPVAARRDLVVVEGAINGLAVERVASTPFGAMLGSTVRPGHVLRLSTFQRLIVLTDPDAAGEKAATKLFALGRHLDVARVELPPGEDAQSIGPDHLRELLDHASRRVSTS